MVYCSLFIFLFYSLYSNKNKIHSIANDCTLLCFRQMLLLKIASTQDLVTVAQVNLTVQGISIGLYTYYFTTVFQEQ